MAASVMLLGGWSAGPAAAASGTAPTVAGGFPPVFGTTLTATPAVPTDSITWESGTTCSAYALGDPAPASSSTTYTLTTSDAGHDVCAVEFSVLGVDGISDPIGPVGSGPVLPAAGQPVTEGETLSVTQGAWGAGANVTDSWFDCNARGTNCSRTPVGTGTSYTTDRSDVGSTLEVEETGSPAGGGASVTDEVGPTGVVSATAPSDETPPSISGTPQVGDTLTALTGKWSNQPTSYAYQWMRCSGGMCNPISSATGQTYVPVAADVGDVLEVFVAGIVDGVAGSAYPSYPTSPIVGVASSGSPGGGSGSGSSGTPGSGVAPIAPTAHKRSSKLLGRLTATMQWTFRYTPSYTQIVALGVDDAVIGSTVTTRCSGKGCPFAIQRIKVRKLKRCASKTTKACRAPRTVNLERRFRGRDLRVGARVTIVISRSRYVGKYYRFVVRGRRQPRVTISCLAPGSSKPGRDCSAV